MGDIGTKPGSGGQSNTHFSDLASLWCCWSATCSRNNLVSHFWLSATIAGWCTRRPYTVHVGEAWLNFVGCGWLVIICSCPQDSGEGRTQKKQWMAGEIVVSQTQKKRRCRPENRGPGMRVATIPHKRFGPVSEGGGAEDKFEENMVD